MDAFIKVTNAIRDRIEQWRVDPAVAMEMQHQELYRQVLIERLQELQGE